MSTGQRTMVMVVADYASGDMAFAEMDLALGRHLPPHVTWKATSVDGFNTLEAGFIIGQLANHSNVLRPDNLIIYGNCAPRKDRSEARMNNEGEKLTYARLKNGVQLVVVNSGYSLSFVRENMEEFYTCKVDRGGSQFRSRDIFPPVVGKVAYAQYDFFSTKLDPIEKIPAPPVGVIGYRDSFGNLKTTYREGDGIVDHLKEGTRVEIEIDGIRRTATVATGNFNVNEGDLAFAPGSSGQERRFWELFQRGGNAWGSFGKPRVGAAVRLVAEK